LVESTKRKERPIDNGSTRFSAEFLYDPSRDHVGVPIGNNNNNNNKGISTSFSRGRKKYK
jgi:hypothetical protein